MNKITLDTFIQKYNLGGSINPNATGCDSSDGELITSKSTLSARVPNILDRSGVS